MRYSSIFSALVLGLSTVNAIPQYNVIESRYNAALERRAPKPAAPEMTRVGTSNGLNVPMLYAGYMEASTGNYERYQCDSGAKPIKTIGTVRAVADRQMITKELLLCMDINLISKKGVIKTHIPPTVCPALKGYTGREKASSGATQDYVALKAALQALTKAHLANMSPFTAVVVHGPYNAFTETETKLVLSDLFGIKFNGVPFQAEVQAAGGSITRVDLSPAQLFIDERPAQVAVP